MKLKNYLAMMAIARSVNDGFVESEDRIFFF